ncbi:MAG: hypothetical protein QG602_2838 [Verrucomicrobiota bacterium]|nr:hypothetical protein [Verrucomicrobiota bacterium]
MKVLFDQGVPLPLALELPGLEITTAHRVGWSNLTNGVLLAAAEQAGVDVFLTTDQNLRYQQNLKGRRLAIIVLPTTRWPDIRPQAGMIKVAIQRAEPGSYLELVW